MPEENSWPSGISFSLDYSEACNNSGNIIGFIQQQIHILVELHSLDKRFLTGEDFCGLKWGWFPRMMKKEDAG
jgi:hypothetical protein